MKIKKMILLVAGIVMGFVVVAQATDFTWDGGSATDPFWSTKKNWGNVTLVSSTNNDLYFGGTVRLSNTNDLTGAYFRNITFNSGAGVFVLNGNAITLVGGITNNSVNAQTLNMNLSLTTGLHSVNAASGNITLAGILSGAGGLTKTGANTLILSGNNTYAGPTTIGAGTLQVGNGGTAGTLGAGNVTNNATLAFNRSNALTVSNAISGSGSLVKSGAGTLILAGDNKYSGSTTISSGTLQIGDGGTTGTLGAGNVTNNSKLAFNRNNTLTVSNAISGSGSLAQSGAGTTILAGNNTYSGSTTIDAGTLQVGNGGTTGTLGTGNVTNNSVLAFNRSDALVVNNIISGSGTLTKSGAGTLTLAGASTYTNTTTVSFGNLLVSGSLQSRLITVMSGALLGGTGTVQTVMMDAGSVLSVGNSPGMMTFAGGLTLSVGATNIIEVASASSYDILKGAGGNSLILGGTTVFDFTGFSGSLTNGLTLNVFQNWGAVSTNGAIFLATGLGGGQVLDISNITSGGPIAIIPEPATNGMLSLGALISILIHRLRREARRR